MFPTIELTLENSRYKELQKIRDKINALSYASSSGSKWEEQTIKKNKNSYRHGHDDGIHRVIDQVRKRNNRYVLLPILCISLNLINVRLSFKQFVFKIPFSGRLQ